MTYATETGSASYYVAVSVFNNDYHLDVVVANFETDSIRLLFGYGNGTFAIGATYSTGARSRSYTVVIGDFNNDNRSDITIVNSGIKNIFLLYGNIYGWTDIVIACYDTDHVETLMKMSSHRFYCVGFSYALFLLLTNS